MFVLFFYIYLFIIDFQNKVSFFQTLVTVGYLMLESHVRYIHFFVLWSVSFKSEVSSPVPVDLPSCRVQLNPDPTPLKQLMKIFCSM